MQLSHAVSWHHIETPFVRVHLFSPQKVDRECASKSAEPFKALTLVRGGGRSKEPSVFALFVQVFVPSFGREGEEKKEGLDLEAGGMMRRLKRFVSGVFRKVPGLSTSADPKGEPRVCLCLLACIRGLLIDHSGCA